MSAAVGDGPAVETAQETPAVVPARPPRWRPGSAAFGLLLVALLVSALGVVYTKHVNRRLFVQLQELQAARDRVQEHWSRLLLEQSTLATHGRVDETARARLGMAIPNPDSVVMLKP